MQPEQGRPEVTLVASSAAPRPAPPDGADGPSAPRGRGRARLLLVLPGLALVAALLSGSPEPPEPEVVFDVTLVLLAERISITQSGVLVLPVEMTNRGGALQVRRAAAYASPVVDDPVLQAPQEVEAGDVRRFVALVAPDCRVLRGGLSFSASVLLRVAQGSVARDVVLDLAQDAAVRERVAGLCAGAGPLLGNGAEGLSG